MRRYRLTLSPKGPPPTNVGNPRANPSAVASSSSANSSHNNANPDADDEEEVETRNLVRGRKTRNRKTPQRSVNNTIPVQNSSS